MRIITLPAYYDSVHEERFEYAVAIDLTQVTHIAVLPNEESAVYVGPHKINLHVSFQQMLEYWNDWLNV